MVLLKYDVAIEMHALYVTITLITEIQVNSNIIIETLTTYAIVSAMVCTNKSIKNII